MKIKIMLHAMTFAAVLASCQTNGESSQKSGIDLANLDSTYLPGTDFYMFATGGWQKAHPLTDEYSRYGSFDVLQENNNKQLRELIEGVAAQQNEKGSVAQKIADLYNSAMDSVALNEHGLDEMAAFLACDGYQTSAQITQDWLKQVWPKMLRQGVDGLMGFYIGADEKDSKNNILSIVQGGLTLGQKDYYLDQDPETAKIREAYVAYIRQLVSHVGFGETDAARISDDVMRIETRLAKASKSMTELRDPEANYHKMSYDQLKKDFAGIDWDAYLHIFGISGLKDVIVGQPEAIHEVEKILAEETPEALQNVYLWHAIDMAAGYVDDESRNLSFAFWGTALSGKTQDRPRWKRAVSSVEGCLGEALGQLYVAKYFPPAAKERMEKLVANLQQALGERIDAQDWMSDETKKVAHEKLDAFYVKVGYPDKWTDYSTLQIGNSYLQNILSCKEWAIQDMIAKHLNKPVDKDEWYMTPQTVNAYYNPTTNEICFPAGILQPPFFDMEADDAFNYGAIGVVIGHEMTHGFDDQGSKYDKNGNLSQWWTEEDTKRFNERIQVMRDYHDSIEVLPGLHSNGSLTLGENMADHGGLMVSYQAFVNATAQAPLSDKDGFTPAQRFFLAYANVWGQNIRDEEIRKRVKSDPHSLGKWRVNGQMPHMDAWYEAFGITEQDPMFVPKEKRVTIW
ncbi:MAG: M13 family metallopeptidase [Bacteroidaceae bacterium]|nr:M13 family metallopeptidase [Paraprevotella sp.]MDY4998044.1 M13 family metallopeptidase [Bacteroidaceae bacterium]MDY5192251.1 M13 family metallopeptidase [Bacteroidaceae bacterium]MDY5542089.1 M13 family metallopeptidase [Bacteroidaceae bacterium]